MKIFISVHWQAQTLNYEVVPSLLMTLCAERVVSCVATRCLRHNNGHDAVPFNSVLWALLWEFWLFQSSDGFDNLRILANLDDESLDKELAEKLRTSDVLTTNTGKIHNDEDISAPRVTLETLRRNNDTVERANRRLKELEFMEEDLPELSKINNQSRGKKSGSVSKATDQIKKVLDWPHFHVTKGVNMEPAEYEDLSWEEFVLGYVRMLRDPDCEFDVALMLEILENLLEDSIDFNWSTVKAFYRTIGLEVEKGKLQWSDSATIQNRRIIKCRVQKGPQLAQKQERKQSRQVNPNSVCCAAYQVGSCDKGFDHPPYIHACPFCFTNRNTVCKHRESQCFFKPKQNPKN